MAVLLGLTRTDAHSPHRTRVYDLKPFYPWSKGNCNSSTQHQTSFSSNDFKWLNGWKCLWSFYQKMRAFHNYGLAQLWPWIMFQPTRLLRLNLWLKLLANVVYLSPYSPDFNPIEHWRSQLKAFLRQFSPTTTKFVDTLIATALDLINFKHLQNWFTNCCYCTS